MFVAEVSRYLDLFDTSDTYIACLGFQHMCSE